MSLRAGDEVEIKPSGWPAVVIEVDAKGWALVRWIKSDGSMEQHSYPEAALRKVDLDDYRDVSPNGGRSPVTGY